VIVRLARAQDTAGFLHLAGQVEQWFGPMVGEPGFHQALDSHVRTGMALVAESGAGILGGMLFGVDEPIYHVHWLVISAQARGMGAGRALVDYAIKKFVRPPATLEVITFGADHPGAVVSGARIFYERLGFVPAEAADPGPEGGSRQVYRLALTR
jgi:GNAT superfamily N-acetyltransferase